MATRGSIAKLNTDGSISAIYVHFDSYLSGVGHTLVNHYTHEHKILALLQLGNLRSLRAEIGMRTVNDRDSRHQTWCDAYGRDYGETDSEASVYQTVQQWLDELGQKYNYLWDGSEWLMCKPHLVGLDNYEFRSVVQCLMENESC
jgi:hypothetical protein